MLGTVSELLLPEAQASLLSLGEFSEHQEAFLGAESLFYPLPQYYVNLATATKSSSPSFPTKHGEHLG